VTRRSEEKLDPILAVLLVLTPLCIGGVPSWVVPAFSGAVFLGLLRHQRKPDTKSASVRVPEGLRLGGFAALWTLLAAIPLPTQLALSLSPLPTGLATQALEFEQVESWRTLSVLPGSSLLEAGRLTALCGLFFLAAQQGWRMCARLISVTALAVFMVGVAQLLLDSQQILGFYSPIDIPPTRDGRWGLITTFVNPNHQAAYFLLASFASLALVVDDRARSGRSGRDPTNSPEQDNRIFFAIALTLQLAGLFLSYSRSALLCATLMHPLAFLLVWRRSRATRGDEHSQALPTWLWLGLAALGLAALGLGGKVAWQELSSLTETTSFERKFGSVSASLQLITGAPLLGTGRGTSVDLLPGVLLEGQGLTFTHIECAPVAMAVEWGPLFAFAVGLLGIRLIIRSWNATASLGRHVILLGLLALAMQNLADFNWEFLGTSSAAIALLGSVARSERHPLDLPRLRLASAGLLATALLTTWVAPRDWSHLRNQHDAVREGRQRVADALRWRPLDPHIHLGAARRDASGGELGAATRRVEFVMKIAPWSADARLLRAHLHRQAGEPTAALVETSMALRLVLPDARPSLLAYLVANYEPSEISALPDVGDLAFGPTASDLLKISPRHASVFATARARTEPPDLQALEIRALCGRTRGRGPREVDGPAVSTDRVRDSRLLEATTRPPLARRPGCARGVVPVERDARRRSRPARGSTGRTRTSPAFAPCCTRHPSTSAATRQTTARHAGVPPIDSNRGSTREMKHFAFAALDALASVAAIEGAAWIVRATIYPEAQYGFEETTVSCVAALMAGIIGSYLLALHDEPVFLHPRRVFARCCLVGLGVGLSTLVISHYVFFQAIGRIALSVTTVLVVLAFSSWRVIYGQVLERGERRPVAAFGHDEAAQRFAREFNSIRHSRSEVVAILSDQPTDYENGPANIAVHSADENTAAKLKELGTDEVILVDHVDVSEERLKLLSDLQGQGIRVSTAGTVWMNTAQQIRMDLVDPRWLVTTFDQLDRPFVAKAKRLADIVVSAIGLLLFALAAPFLWILVRLDSAGGFIYSQERIGFGGRPFRIHKIRTMVSDPKSEQQWAASTDARTTRVGRFLRRTRIDELPQFLNVLRGEMSLVGPRPEQPAIVAKLEDEIPFFGYRHLVKPGITGWAQIHQGYAASVEESATKLSYDLYYVRRYSLLLDLDILARTAFVMAARIGSR
jgi:exopolysaccharide biosynthesis polyprenyl glycosylphosphotransferase